MGERLGLKVPDGETRARLQRLEQREGAHNVKQWAAEGMKAETMGIPPDMREFRERQAQRSAEIPYDIERRNRHSEQRSEEAVQRMGPAGETGVPDSVRDVISSSGQSLDASIQRAMEDRMGDSLGDVRVHTGPQAAEACDEINARAFTVGNHVAFNSGEYDPESAEGQHVLAHELAHVRQQTGGAVSMLPQEDVGLEIDPDPALEREAEETAQRVMEGGKLGIQRMKATEFHVQRVAVGDDGTFMGYDVGPLNLGGSKDEQEQGVPADPEVLAKEVKRIKENQKQVMETLSEARPGAPTKPGAGGWGKTAVKGVAGSLTSAGSGAALGVALGSAVPGVGTAVGAATGAVTGMVGDLTKKGVEYGADRLPGSQSQELQQMYDEISQMYEELKEGYDHGGSSSGDAQSRR